MSQISQSWKLRRRASRLACARISRVSAKTLASCGESNCGTEAVGAFISSLLFFVGPAPVPQRKLHRSEPQRAQQLRHGGQDLGGGHRVGLLGNDRRKRALL